MTRQNGLQKRIDQDSELVREIQAGRMDLFPEVVRRYGHKLYNFAYRMCGQASDAEDVVQDTFLNAYRYILEFRHETKLKNWLYRILTSSCIKKRRQSKYAPDRELSLEEFLPADESHIEREVPAWAAMPLDQVLNEELSRAMKQAILALPENYRVVLVLRDLEGFSTEESAQILNLTPSNIKVRLHRARLFLRDQLKAYFNDDQPSA